MNPQTPNTQPFFGQKVSKQGVNVTQATDKDLIYKNDYSTTLYYDSLGVPHVLLGLRNFNNTQGLFVSEAGVDVTRATDAQLIFNSNQDIFKIVGSDNFVIPTISLGSSSFKADTITIPHNLPFIPILQSYAQVLNFIGTGPPLVLNIINSYVPLPYTADPGLIATGSSVSGYIINASIDATNIYFFYFYSTDASGSMVFPAVPIRYYLLQETVT